MSELKSNVWQNKKVNIITYYHNNILTPTGTCVLIFGENHPTQTQKEQKNFILRKQLVNMPLTKYKYKSAAVYEIYFNLVIIQSDTFKTYFNLTYILLEIVKLYAIYCNTILFNNSTF